MGKRITNFNEKNNLRNITIDIRLSAQNITKWYLFSRCHEKWNKNDFKTCALLRYKYLK